MENNRTLSHSYSLLLTRFLIILSLIDKTKLQFTAIRFGTPNCVKRCLEANPDWYFCTERGQRNMGWCCPPGSTRNECRESANFTCSLGVTDQLAKYAYCPRKTSVCASPGKTLGALINQN